jgi:putative transposase
MARANRHFIPGFIWHLTHRCHKREFLLRFAKDRRRWLQWLYEAKKRYGLTILNYAVTSNHIHLLVKGNGDRDVIPKSIKLVAGRIGQEYNQRKQRRGAFWEDRYHATAVEGGQHLLRCLVYIDLNMVRAGMVKHPSQWLFGGYNEIQAPKKKNVLIDYEGLRAAVGLESYEQVKSYHKKWVEELLQNGKNLRDDKWSKSIAVGGQAFIEAMKSKLDGLVMGRKVIETVEGHQLRDPAAGYMARSDTEKCDIGLENAHFWDIT